MEFSEIFLLIKGIFSNIFLEKIRYKSEIKKKQFENENKIYKKTWNVLRGFKETTYCLFNGDPVDVNEEILKRYRLDKYNKFKEKHEKFQDCIEENRIFYKQDIYNDIRTNNGLNSVLRMIDLQIVKNYYKGSKDEEAQKNAEEQAETYYQ